MQLSSIHCFLLVLFSLVLDCYYSVIDSFACVGDSCLDDGFKFYGFLCIVGLDTRL